MLDLGSEGGSAAGAQRAEGHGQLCADPPELRLRAEVSGPAAQVDVDRATLLKGNRGRDDFVVVESDCPADLKPLVAVETAAAGAGQPVSGPVGLPGGCPSGRQRGGIR
ncbi:hypothetical protein GCM10022245_51700 [Streptomyces mayteni]